MRCSLLAAVLLLLSACTSSEEPAPDAFQSPDGAGPQCNYNGTLYDDGEIFPAGDGCNSCKCNPDGVSPGEYGCSLIACDDAGTRH